MTQFEDVEHVICFDGVCHLCHGLVRFVVSRDREKRFYFAPLQAPDTIAYLALLGVDAERLNTVVYIRHGKVYRYSSAVLRMMDDLGGIWRVFWLLLIIPAWIRDIVYRGFARFRYGIFGRSEMCMVPRDDVKDRFLGV